MPNHDALFPSIGVVLDNFIATTPPTADDDANDGYGVSSRWLNTATGIFYICVDDNPGAAVWSKLAGKGSVSFARKTNSTNFTTTSFTDDPDLALPVQGAGNFIASIFKPLSGSTVSGSMNIDGVSNINMHSSSTTTAAVSQSSHSLYGGYNHSQNGYNTFFGSWASTAQSTLQLQFRANSSGTDVVGQGSFLMVFNSDVA